MADITFWKWEVKDARRRSGWRLLTWRMTEERAAQWAATNSAELRRVEGSREDRATLQEFGPDEYLKTRRRPDWLK